MSALTPARRHGPGSSHRRPVRTGRLVVLALAIGLAPPAAGLAPAQSVLPPTATEDGVPADPSGAGGAVPGAAEPRSEPPATEAAGEDGGAGAHMLPRDLSPWGMFLAADVVVKAVMVGLALASLVTWTVWLAKSAEIAAAKVRGRRALAVLAASNSLAQAHRALSNRRGAVPLLVRAADHEVQVSLDDGGSPAAGLLARVASALSRIEAQAGRRMTRGTGVLATIASTAPFVGLFGTVWGIMNAFIGISEAQTTNLAVVAPGIAEALLATALGLVAAIPAVVIYNHFARSISGYRQLLGDAAAAVERLVSRDLDRRSLRPAMRQAAE